MGTFIDLTGQKFDRLTVQSKSPVKGVAGKIQWICICECGNTVTTLGNSLSSGKTKSCGCKKVEAAIETGKQNTTHGMRNSSEYISWSGMLARCHNPNDASYPRYGGRGIGVCSRWASSFENFYEDMGPKPGPEYSIERDDVNGNYEYSNCRWATDQEQANNRRNNVVHSVDGQSITSAELSRKVGMSRQAVQYHLDNGLSVEEVIKRYRQK